MVFQMIKNVITPREERLLVKECEQFLNKRKYMHDHWDDVIVGYREIEKLRTAWSEESQSVLERIVKQLPKREYMPTVHVIDLAPDGFIRPHIDSIKFSGDIVAGLSLLSPRTMRLQRDNEVIEELLGQRSLYVMQGDIRYDYTHEILPETLNPQRRLSIIFRNVC